MMKMIGKLQDKLSMITLISVSNLGIRFHVKAKIFAKVSV